MTTTTKTFGPTLRSLAEEHAMQTHELAAFLDLGTDYDELAVLDGETEATYRDMLAAGAALEAEGYTGEPAADDEA